jgi:MSHA type pilus biogenesis protein MshL
VKLLLIVFLLLFLTNCRDLATKESLTQPLTPQDMKTLTSPVAPIAPAEKKKPVHKDTSTLNPVFLQPISISVSENQPLKPIFIELARQAGIGLQLDPNINSKIVFSAKNQPFIQVIESMCDLANLRYKIDNLALRIEVDLPYTANYNVQFLNLSRNSQNRISIATDVFSNVNANKNAIDNGSNSSVSVTGTNDFWNELENNLKIILGSGAPPPAQGTTTLLANYSLHRQAGVVSVLGTSKHHKEVSNYLETLRKSATSQVLIEAKIVEINLKDEFKSGINWQKIGSHSDWQFNAKFGDFSRKSHFLDPNSAQTDMISMGASGTTFSAILQALQEFGASRTLSSPRLTVMNNQTAILKVAKNQVYFRLNYDKQYNSAVQRESIAVSSDIQTVPIGLVMSVQPSIDLSTGEIILFLRPTISRLCQSVKDPAIDIAYNANTSENSSATTQITPSLIPIVEVREIDSILRIKDGEIAILGGLMEIRSIQDSSKFPGLGDVPIVKELFSSYTEGDQVVELVILLRAKILQDAAYPDAVDQRLIRDYVRDPRPMV